MIRSTIKHRQRYVSVTSAMSLCKSLLGEQPDYYGPDAEMHAAEGEGCHRTCLDWLASREYDGLMYRATVQPEAHGDEKRWHAVMAVALANFQVFVEQYKVRPIGLEQVDFSKTYGLVGHIDLPCYFTIPGRREMKGPIDLKFTASIQESHRLQVRCYGKLDGMREANMGGIFWSNRKTGEWRFEPVNLSEHLDDVMAVSYAAKLWAWGQGRKGKS